MNDALSILIPTHNRADLLKQTLRSLHGLNIPEGVSVELIVVANGCTDDTPRVVADDSSHLPVTTRFVEEPRLGVSNARNRAIQEAHFDLLAFLDDDVQLSPNWITGLLDVFTHHPADVLAGRIELWWGEVEEPDWLTPGIAAHLSALNHGNEVIELTRAAQVTGACFAFRREVFDRAGPFRTDLGRTGRNLDAGEETDWVARALDAGCRVFYAPNMMVRHWVAANRVKPAYLKAAFFGSGKAQALYRPNMTALRLARSIIANSIFIFLHTLAATLGRITGNRRQYMHQFTIRAQRLGLLAGVWQRHFRKSVDGVDRPTATSTSVPSFSVIMSAYNAADYVEAAIESVLAQSCRDFELIIVDDGSTDDTPHILQRYEDRAHIIRQENQGLGAAKNRGAEQASHDYLVTLDADDLWPPWTLEGMQHVIRKHHAPTLVFMSRKTFTGGPPVLPSVDPRSITGRRFDDFLSAGLRDVVGGGLCAIRTESFRAGGGFAEFDANAQDIDLFLRIGTAPGCVYTGPTPLVFIRQHDQQATGRAKRIYIGHRKLIQHEIEGRYAGGLERRLQRIRRICKHVRNAATICALRGHAQLALDLYRRSWRWQLRLGRFRFLLGLPLLVLFSPRPKTRHPSTQ
ncbi:MAG: hypothetical protein CMJ49_11570 [Planctomycetaceae bacterium]|nr:hypothetical protein [Planctomycetaceae bacterium]